MAHAMLLIVPPAEPGLLAAALVPTARSVPSNQDPTVMIIVAGVLFTLLGAISAWVMASRSRRHKELRAAAAADGWIWSAQDPYGCDNLPFEVFRQGHGRGCDNVLSIPGHPRNLRAFDFWYYHESREQNGKVQRTYRRLSAASIEVGWMWPELTIRPENLLTRAAKHVGLQDIQFESDTFNRMFQVLCADRRFASALIDAEMIDFLVATQGKCAFEVSGRYAVAVAKKEVPGAYLPAFGRLLEAFAERVPRIVYELYPVPARLPPRPAEAWGWEKVRSTEPDALENRQRIPGWEPALPGTVGWVDPNRGPWGRRPW